MKHKYNTTRLLVSLIALFACQANLACTCDKLGSTFFETIYKHNKLIESGEFPLSDALTVFSGKVIRYQDAPPHTVPPAMLVEVKQVAQGKLEKQTIWIQGDTDGLQCRPPIIWFDLGAKYWFATNKDSEGNHYLSVCGQYYIKTSAANESTDYL